MTIRDRVLEWFGVTWTWERLGTAIDHIDGAWRQGERIVRMIVDMRAELKELLPPEQRFAMVWGKASCTVHGETFELPVSFEPRWLRKGERATLTINPQRAIRITEARCNEPFVIRRVLIGTRIQDVYSFGAAPMSFAYDEIPPGTVAAVEVEWPAP